MTSARNVSCCKRAPEKGPIVHWSQAHWSQVQGSGLRRRRVIAGGGERSQVEVSGLRCGEVVSGVGVR